MSVADTVNEWFRQRVACGAVAQHTPAYNQVRAALPALIEALQGAAAERPAEAGEAPPADEPPHEDPAPPSA